MCRLETKTKHTSGGIAIHTDTITPMAAPFGVQYFDLVKTHQNAGRKLADELLYLLFYVTAIRALSNRECCAGYRYTLLSLIRDFVGRKESNVVRFSSFTAAMDVPRKIMFSWDDVCLSLSCESNISGTS